MATFLKQSTAVTVKVGPFLDDTDGKTAETALTLTQPDVRLAKNGGAFAQLNAAQTLDHEEAGWYNLDLDTTDTNTLGILIVAIHESGALPVWREFMVVPANVYDSLVGGSDKLQADVQEWLGSAAATPTVAGVPEVDVTHWKGTGATGMSYGFLQAGADWVAITNAQAGGESTITLAASSVATDGAYVGFRVWIMTGTGAKQARRITAYNGTTKVATVSPAWTTVPDATSVYVLQADAADSAAGVASAVRTELATELGRIDVDVSSRVGGGAGALTRTIGVTAGGNPLEGASVWVSTDAAGTNIVAGPLTTDSGGEVTVLLDAGTYYAWVQKDGYGAILGTSFTLSA